MSNLEKLLYLRGVAAEYFNYSGERVVVPHEVRLQLLQAVGYDVSSATEVEQAIYALDAAPWKSWLKPLLVVTAGVADYFDIRVSPQELQQTFAWRVITESGEHITGELLPAALAEVGDYSIAGVRYSARRQPLPELAPGYHQLELTRQRQARAILVVAPPLAFTLADVGVQGGVGPVQRPWGINCQLYTLRSERNWGVGDFTDLRELIELGSAAGMDLICLNPLHAPQLSTADFASPYSPSDRRFLNPLYIDPARVQDFGESKNISKLVKSAAFQRKLADLRSVDLVNYDGVATLKYWVFDELFRVFRQQHMQRNTDRARSFHRFVQQGGPSLEAFAGHVCAHNRLQINSARDPRFHMYLQWIADEQLAQCQALALQQGMTIGLMGDLAVGAVKGGAEVESNPGLFCHAATIGAPPDQFAVDGQNWDLPALDPIALQQDNYRHFIDLLRANMSHCGALRIDHVMGLLRLWWCLPGASVGAYVYYPLEDLMAILRLESWRHCCLVVGEDMGVVPDAMRVSMAASSVYSNKVFYFEKTAQEQFKLPQDHATDALLMVTNHDVAPLAGWWHGASLRLQCEIGLLDAVADLPALLAQREEDKRSLLHWLQSLQLLPESWCEAADAEGPAIDKAFDMPLCAAVLRANARSRSQLLLLQLEDLQLMQQPVNIPGTYREYPNWRRKQMSDTKALLTSPDIKAVLAQISQERAQ